MPLGVYDTGGGGNGNDRFWERTNNFKVNPGNTNMGQGTQNYGGRGTGSAGAGENGKGDNGVYYDYSSGSYRSTITGIDVGFSTAYNAVSPYFDNELAWSLQPYAWASAGGSELVPKAYRLEQTPGSGSSMGQINNYTTIAGMGMAALSYAAKSAADYTPKYGYKGMAQIEAAAAKSLGNMARVTRLAGITGSVLTTGYSSLLVINQINAGGIQNVNGWDVTDAGVGVLGLGATGLAYFGIISNPIGWGIGAGVLIYGGSRLVYNLYNEP